jgi:multiple sugar transport system ATP-binding protein
MVRKPSVFLMDEPLSNLDAKLREHMRVELVRLHKKLETTTIYVTHDQVEAMTMADQIILMNDGKIQQDGAPDDFYNRPENLFVAQFIGSPSINLVAGKIENGVFIDSNNELKITPEQSAASSLKEYEGKEVTIGIRPERFNEDKDSNSFSGIVMNVEALGMIKILYVKLPSGKELVITAPGHSKFKVDETYTFSFQVEAIHYFDTKTGLRIN